MSRVRLTWANASTTIVEQRVYRSTSPLDINNMPEPLAILPRRDRGYLDNTIEDGLAYYYAVSSVLPDYSELISKQIRVEATPVSDPHWDKVVALLHFDGDLADETGNTWSGSGVSYGPDSAVFGGDSSYIRTGTIPVFGGGDFTVEGWFMPTQTGGATVALGATVTGNRISYESRISSTRWSFYYTLNNSTEHIAFNIALPEQITSKTHWAISRNGNVVTAYLDGKEVAAGAISGELSGTPMYTYIGRRQGANVWGSFAGNYYELRITKGVARYTENFTPPTEPFPNN